MKWNNMDIKPPFNPKDDYGLESPPILVRFKKNKGYYIVRPCVRNGEIYRYREADGEQFAWWEPDELIAWTTYDELDADYEKNGIYEE